MRVIIIGAGIAGLSAAIAFRQAGWDVAVYEQAEKLEPMGAAISIWPNAVAALDLLGCAAHFRALATPLDHVALAEKNGRDLARFQVSDITAGQTAFLITRTALQSVLLAALGDVQLHLGHKLASFQASEANMKVRFTNEVEAQADLLVAADGIRSRIAEALTGVAPAHAGYGGLLALTGPVVGHPPSDIGIEYWGQGERMGVFDLGEGRKYWFYMKNEDRAEEAAATSLAFVAERMRDWPDEARAAIAATPADHIIPFSIHAKPPPKMLGRGRVILAGDAAHAMEPNMGQGACQALEDAVALGAAAAVCDADGMVHAYQHMRLKRIRRFVSLSRQGSIVAHRLPAPLAFIARAMMRLVFARLATRQQRELYSLPDYKTMVATSRR